MAKNLPVHVSDDEEEILSDNKEEIEYDSVSEMSLDFNFDEEDDEFQASLVVPQEPPILSQQQPHLHPLLS